MAHISLDIWNTLFIPNPEYAKWRTNFLAERLDIDSSRAKKIYTSVKTCVDNDAEEKGISYRTDEVYVMLVAEYSKQLHIPFPHVTYMLTGMRPAFEQKFREMPPTVLADAIRVIKAAQAAGHTFSIASNTNFITGPILAKHLSSLGLDFLFYVFSDLHGCAKPNPKFFQMVQNQYHTAVPRPDPITHIGDNPVCDDPKDLMAHIIIKGPQQLASAIEGVL